MALFLDGVGRTDKPPEQPAAIEVSRKRRDAPPPNGVTRRPVFQRLLIKCRRNICIERLDVGGVGGIAKEAIERRVVRQRLSCGTF